MRTRDTSGFTLIELLIVVAIIAILAAIAVPNFLEAQTRSKVSRIKADMRSIAAALEAYAVDSNTYPPEGDAWDINVTRLDVLTTPIAYMSSIDVTDPFMPPTGRQTQWYWAPTLTYCTYCNYWMKGCYPGVPLKKAAILASAGPDMTREGLEHYPVYMNNPSVPRTLVDEPCDWIYDATNGTKSKGGLGRTVGDAGAGTLNY